MVLKGESGQNVRKVIESMDYPDMRIIRILSDDEKDDEKDDENSEKKDKIAKLQKRINNLEEFTYLRDSLLKSYKERLSELDK